MSMATSDSDNMDVIVEQLRLQLSEVDMLQSMFPNDGEFQLDDPSVVADVTDYVDGGAAQPGKELPARVDFTVQLHISDSIIFLVTCSLPHAYPATLPEIFVRSSKLDRKQQHDLNRDLTNYMNTLDKGELCICSVIEWLQDNGARYAVDATNEQASQVKQVELDDGMYFTRYWIYSHHIYNKEKRRKILLFAKDFNISGFCLHGKPGIICAEGTAANCDKFWTNVKQMTWKKILCKMKEVVERKTPNIDRFRRFTNFEEIVFEVRRGAGREYHMDMGEFYQYLENHNSGYVFKNYFGVYGKSNTT